MIEKESPQMMCLRALFVLKNVLLFYGTERRLN